MNDEEFLERAIINTLREAAGCKADPRFELAAAKLVRELDNKVRDLTRGPGTWVPHDATNEERLDIICQKVTDAALDQNVTLVLSGSVRVGKMHYQRVAAQSPHAGEYGASLVDGCMEQVAIFRRNMTKGNQRD